MYRSVSVNLNIPVSCNSYYSSKLMSTPFPELCTKCNKFGVLPPPFFITLGGSTPSGSYCLVVAGGGFELGPATARDGS